METQPVVGYCVRCKSRQEMQEAKLAKLKNGHDAYKGKCPKCGCSMVRIASVKDGA